MAKVELSPSIGRPLRYLTGLLNEIIRKNGWQRSERMGERRPRGVQPLVNDTCSGMPTWAYVMFGRQIFAMQQRLLLLNSSPSLPGPSDGHLEVVHNQLRPEIVTHRHPKSLLD